MAGTELGALKAAATRIGIPLTEYTQMVAAGEKWCTGCKRWHPRAEFRRDGSRRDGLSAACTRARRGVYERTYVPRGPAPSRRGRRYAEPRDGDALQARGRVNTMVAAGLLPDPDDVPCSDCGHETGDDGVRHEYDHHRGYAAEHHEDVEAVCVPCHHDRERRRRGR